MAFHSFQARLVLTLLLILLPVLGGGGFFLFQGEVRLLRAEFDSGLVALAMGLSSFGSGEDGGVCARISHLESVPEMPQGAAVYSPAGKLLCQGGGGLLFPGVLNSERIRSLTDRRSSSWSSSADGMSLRVVAIALSGEGERAGSVLVVGRPEQVLQQKARHVVVVLVVSVAAIVLGAVFLSMLLVRRTLRPIAQLADWVRVSRDDEEDKASLLPPQMPLELVRVQQSVADLRQRLSVELNRARRFAADASHELRTPLTILRGEIEVALRWAPDPEEARRVLASNLEEINRMSRIVEDLLLLSRSEAGELTLSCERIDLFALLGDICHQMQAVGEAEEVAVECEVPAQKISLLGDSLRLRQMFLNLLGNAIKYTPSGGRVHLRAGLLGSLVEVRIVDTGIGIESHHLPHIFDRFYRVDEARNRSDGGAGLGLSIVRWVAERHGGGVEVHSAPGQGSEFVVVLPFEAQRG